MVVFIHYLLKKNYRVASVASMDATALYASSLVIPFRQDLKDKPSSLFVAFILADYCPNIREIFHILLTMPIGSVPCERSFSALRRLKQCNTGKDLTKNFKTIFEMFMSVHNTMNVSKVIYKCRDSQFLYYPYRICLVF
jgi:hypothetical protein